MQTFLVYNEWPFPPAKKILVTATGKPGTP